VVAEVVAGAREVARSAAFRAGRPFLPVQVQLVVAGLQAPRAGPHQLAGRARERGLEQLDASPRAHHARLHRQRLERHRAQDLAGDPPQAHVRARLAALDRAAEQGGGRAGVLGVRVPRAAGGGCGTEAVAVLLEEGFGHAQAPIENMGRKL
jgi:hypothetical protein